MRNFIVCFLIGLFITWQSNAQTEAPPIILELGEQRSLNIPELSRFSVSGNAIRYTRTSSSLLIKGSQEGLSNLYLEKKKSELKPTGPEIIQIKVVRSSTQYPTALLEQLNGLRSVEILKAAGQFVIRGTLGASQLDEAKKLALIRDKYPQTIIDEVEISDEWKSASMKAMSETTRLYPEVQLSWIENQPWAVGSVETNEIAASLARRLKMIQPLVRTQIQTFSQKEPTVYLKIFLLEVTKEQMSDWGVEWPVSHVGKFGFYQSKIFTETSPIDLSLNMLEKKKSLKILSSPELVVKTPGKAELFAGGEMPIRQRSKFADTVTWKTVGLMLKLETLGIAGSHIRLSVETSLSHFNDAFSNDEIPGIQNNEMKTSVEAQFGKPLLLSGLIQENFSENSRGLPYLQRIPILGKLFSSDAYLNHLSELVAILVPYRGPPESPQLRIRSDLPRGYLPLAREQLSKTELQEKINSKDYPWNVL